MTVSSVDFLNLQVSRAAINPFWDPAWWRTTLLHDPEQVSESPIGLQQSMEQKRSLFSLIFCTVSICLLKVAFFELGCFCTSSQQAISLASFSSLRSPLDHHQ